MAEKRGPSGVKTRLKPSQLAGRALVPALQAWSSLGIRFSLQRANGGVDRATALPSSCAGPMMMRNSLPVAPVQRFVMHADGEAASGV